MIDETRYLRFVRQDFPDRLTPLVAVCSKSGGYSLGSIGWYGAWRQFCFFPAPDCVFNKECMTDILGKIDELMEERRG